MLSTQEVERRKKSPAWAGLSISEERRTTAYAVRSTTRSLARPLRSLCNGDHRSALFTAELLRACSANCGASEWGKIGRTPPRTERRNPAPVAPRGGVLLLDAHAVLPLGPAGVVGGGALLQYSPVFGKWDPSGENWVPTCASTWDQNPRLGPALP